MFSCNVIESASIEAILRTRLPEKNVGEVLQRIIKNRRKLLKIDKMVEKSPWKETDEAFVKFAGARCHGTN